MFNVVSQMEGKRHDEPDVEMKDTTFVSAKKTAAPVRETEPAGTPGDVFEKLLRTALKYKSSEELKGDKIPAPAFEARNVFGGSIAEGLTGAHNPSLGVSVEPLMNLETYDHWNKDKENKALDQELRDVTAQYQAQLGDEVIDKFGDPGTSLIVGRVRLIESETTDTFELVNNTEDAGAANIVSVVLRSETPTFWFPGQIVCLRGSAESSTKFEATEIIKLTSTPPAPVDHRDMGHMSIMYANGPYTMGSLSYKPLKNFLEKVAREQPHVVVMGGPFIDCNHPDVKSGEIFYEQEGASDVTCLSDRELILEIMALIDSKWPASTRLVLVPSLKDITSLFPLPQPPLHHNIVAKCSEGFKDRVVLGSNPYLVSVNGLKIGVLTTDVVLNLMQASTTTLAGPSKLHGILEAVLSYSVYPLVPSAKDVPLDLNQVKHL